MQEAKDSANIISEADLQKANEFRIKVEEMKDQLGFFATKIAIAVMPTLHKVMDWAQGKLPLVQSFFENAFDVAGKAISKVSEVIQDKVIPKLQDLWAWIEPKLPQIEELFMTSFGVAKDVLMDVVDAIQDATKWIQDHWNIVEPILIGIAAGVTTFYLITGAIAAYGAITKAITAIQLAFNTALALNPIGLVVIAIGLLVAAGVMLWKNWSVVKEKLGEFWSWIKEKSASIFNGIMDFFKKWGLTILSVILGPIGALVIQIVKNWDSIKAKSIEIFNKVKDAVVGKVTDLASKAVAKFTELKTGAVNKFNDVLSSAKSKFNEIKSAIMTPIETARDKVKTAVDKIKGFFTGMKLELPKIKVPSFSLKNWSKNPIDWLDKMPSIGINWNSHGALFTKPTVFNTPMGLQGFGEAGAEAALPLNNSVLGMIGQKIADTMTGQPPQITQNITINSPEPLSPSGVKQKMNEVNRKLALEWGM
jgi:hypothetical protein